MRPNVDKLIVRVEERGKGSPVAVALGAVAGLDKMVVAPPRRQVVPENYKGRGDLLLHVQGGLLELG